MNVLRILLTTLLLIILCHTSSAVKNDRGGPSFNAGNFLRNSRRIALNEYLVPPPPPRHSLRAGRVANPAATEEAGYFSKFMNWLNPFNYVSSPSPPPAETAYQPRNPPFNSQPLHPPSGASLYPPLGPPPGSHPVLQHPIGVPPGPPPNQLPFYNAPAILHNVQSPPPVRTNPTYVTLNKGKSCNPCNRIPWIPMQGGLRSDEHPPQLSNGYLPPPNVINHDNQHSASHEISVPSFPQVPINPLISSLPNPQLLPHPVPPYHAESFDGRSPSPTGHLEPTLTTIGQEYNPAINGQLNIRGNEDLAPSGTHTDQGLLSAAPQNYGFEGDKAASDKEPFERDQPPISAPPGDSQVGVSSFGSSNFGNHFSESSGYRESNVHYEQSQDLNPQSSFGSSFNDQNYQNNQYSDLSSSSSVIKNSQVPEENNASSNTDFVHFEESPLLDLTNKEETHSDTQWPTSTVTYNEDNILKTTTDYSLETDNVYFEDSSNFIRQSESYSLSDIRNINGAFETTSASGGYKNVEETSTISTPYTNQNIQQGLVWTDLELKNESLRNHAFSDTVNQWNSSNTEINRFEKQGNPEVKNTTPRQQSVKRNKQVQVVIPYTSEYTPVPFQQSYGDWSIKTNFERTQPRKVPSNGQNIDNYIQQESRNDIRVINHLQSQFNDSNKSNVQPIKAVTNTIQNSTRNFISKIGNSIDVRRLQKNIDNWTIQEYSKPTTSNTVSSSSPHPYLLPSKKIPTKYLTTTEPGESKDHNESVKTYSLAGFSFNEVEHEGSASNHIEETRTPAKVLRVETTKTPDSLESSNKSATEEKSTWKAYSVSISPVDKERVYVVTPQAILETVKNTSQEEKENSQQMNETKITSTESNGNFSEFEAIEKAYQVLPQAVNNLAVASTGKENIPLWGIMEHEEFASLNLDETGEGATGEGVDGPVLYSGHSKVSRAKR
nr:PREDICTED: uncharacterized protein LOC100881600 isoform X1 [Megachile rotundata]